MWVRRLLLGMALILAAAGGASYLHGLRDLVPVVVTTAGIPAHAPLTADKLTVQYINRAAAAAIAADAVQRPEDAAGLVARVDIPAGEVVRRAPWLVKVVPEGGARNQDRYLIPDGMRLVGLRVDQPGAVTGRVRPGDRVDVIFTSRSADTGGVYAQTVLQAVEIYAVAEKGKGTLSTDTVGTVDVALLVTPEQAQVLALVKRSGGAVDLSLAPANPVTAPLAPALPPARSDGKPVAGGGLPATAATQDTGR